MSYIGNSPSSVAFLTDTFNGNGSTTVFTMSVAPATTSSMLVAITGVVQDPSTYSINGTTLTFSAAPPSGTGNISVRYLGIPASGVATTAYRTVTEFTATAGQTTFSVPSYTVGYIDVYRNGVMLGSADYTATNGTTVVLAVGATAGDLVETISFFVSSVLNAIPASAGAVISTYIANDAVGAAQIAAGAVGTSEIASSVTLTTPTLSSPVTSGTPSGVGVLTSGTAVASTSGTSIDFTGIPSWVKRITVMLNAVSTNGSSIQLLQIGAGSIETTGYASACAYFSTAGSNVYSTNGFNMWNGSGGDIRYATFVLTLVSENTWLCTHSGGFYNGSSAFMIVGGGNKSLSGTLDRVRVTTANGTDAFDAGSINILYE